MRSSFLRGVAPWGAAFLFAAFVSIGSSSCGQKGVVAAGGSADGGGGSTGGIGGAGSGSTGGGGSGGGEPVKVMNWNLHNFFDKKKDTNSPDEMVLSASAYTKKLGQVGTVIKAMDPDFAIMAECENKGILDDLNKNELGSAYETAITETNDFRGLDIGVISKVPIEKVVTHVDDNFKRLDLAGSKTYTYSRDAVEVHLKVGTRSVILIGVHYRSKGDGSVETDDKDKRAAEAQHSRAIADALAKEDPTAAIVILGDYNDLPGSAPVAWSLSGDPANDPKVKFTDAADFVPEAERYTFVYQGGKELIDHQIMNPVATKLLDQGAVIIRHQADVEDASDHYPLMATYMIK